MSGVKVTGILMIAGGVLGLVSDRFTYTRETHEAKLGPIELTVKDQQTVNVSTWAGVGAVVLGSLLLLFGRMME